MNVYPPFNQESHEVFYIPNNIPKSKKKKRILFSWLALLHLCKALKRERNLTIHKTGTCSQFSNKLVT